MKLIPTTLMSAACGAAILLGTAAFAQTAAPAAPAAAPNPAIGDVVYGPAGGEIGRVTAMTDGNPIIDTGTHKVAIPPASFARNDKGLVLSATKEQVDAFGQQADDAAKAALTAALVPGAAVNGINGAPVGSVKAIEAGLVEVTTPKGAVKLPATAFVVDKGALKIGMTQQEFDAAVTAAVTPG